MALRTRALLCTAVVSVGLIVWWTTPARVAVPADGVASGPSAESSPPPSIADRAPVLAGAAGAKLPAASPHGEDDPALPNSAALPAAQLEPAHLTGVVRDAKTRATIVGARILVGVNERTMHDLRVVAKPPLEARTDAQGLFSLEVPVPAEGLTIRVDAMSKGYRSLAGSYAAGAGNALRVRVKPGSAHSVELELTAGFAVAGVVRDETGRPLEDVQIEAHEEDKTFTRYMAFTRTDGDGRFEVHDFDVGDDSAQDLGLAEARLHFDHADFVPLVSDDLRKRTEPERTSLEFRMVRGFAVEGVVRTPEGVAAAGLLLEAVHADQGWRRSVLTGKDGAFQLRGVSKGSVVLRVADHRRRLVGSTRVTLVADAQRVGVDLAPIPGNEPRTSVRLLGLELVELTEAERVAFDFPEPYHVLVVGAGEDPEALGVGRLEPGDCIWTLADKPVPTIRALAEILVSEADARAAKWGVDRARSFRIVYGMRREGGFAGTNTQGLTLSAAQLADVRAWLAAQPK